MNRIPCEVREGRLYVGAVGIGVRDQRGTLEAEVREALGLGARWHVRQCVECPTWFLGTGTLTCSDTCHQERHRRQVAAVNAAQRENRASCREFEARHHRKCSRKGCERALTHLRGTRRFCSDACRQAWHRWYKRELKELEG